MTKTLDEVLKEIDSLKIYEKDYKIIVSLLENVKDQRLFSKIVEEVLNGNLEWSDFDRLFSYTNYSDIIKENADTQKELEAYVERFTKFKETLKEKYNYDDYTLLSNNSKFIYNKESNDGFYKDEKTKNKKNIIYELVTPSEKDNALTIAIKAKLLDDLLASEDNSALDDIFVFLDSYILPIDYRYQTLNSFDIGYMKIHGLSENQMKQFKTISFLLREKKYNANEGGN